MNPIADDGETSATSSPGSSTETETGQNSDPSDSNSGDTETETDESMDTGVPSPADVGPVVDCDIFAQDCAVGDKCVPWASSGGEWDDYKCVPILGEQATGEACTYDRVVEAADDCDGTGFCFDGTCHAFCSGTPQMPECPEGNYCSISSDALVLCIPTCDPTVQNCTDGEGCYWTGSNFTCIPVAEPAGAPGDACRFTNACEPGTVCIDAAVMPDCQSTGCCGEFCELGLGDMQCADVPGTTCVAFWENQMAPEGFEHVGVCIVPP